MSDTPRSRLWYTLSETEIAAINQAREVLLANEAVIERLRQADRTDDWATIRRLAPQMPPIIAAVDAVWSLIWPDTDPATIAPGVRLGMFISYLYAAHVDRAQRLLVTPGTPPSVA